jgi:hypothetical protein
VEIAFQRSSERQSFAVVRRDDGVTLRVPGYGPALPQPHDLAHYVVERELRLRRGFWASVAAGGVFPGMQHLSGRRKPHADERSRAVLRANGSHITQAEVLVGTLLAIVTRELDRVPQRALAILTEAQSGCVIGAYPLDAEGLRAVCAALRRMAACWQGVDLGHALTEVWDEVGDVVYKPMTAGVRQRSRTRLPEHGRASTSRR